MNPSAAVNPNSEQPRGSHLYNATEVAVAIDVARNLAAAGVPIFLARPALDAAGRWEPEGGSGESGYWIPDRWQRTPPDPAVVDQWQPGYGLAAVMGHGLDGVDVDPRNGGDTTARTWADAGQWPRSYGVATTPSGGLHYLVAPLMVRSRDGALPGVDVKAGVDGEGHGFLWIAPTVRKSKTTGKLGAYRWVQRPDMDQVEEFADSDDTGGTLGAHIAALRVPEESQDTPHEAYQATTPEAQERVRAYLAKLTENERERFTGIAAMPEGARDERDRGWEKMTSDLANRLGRLARADWTPWGEEDARQAFTSIVPPTVAAAVDTAEKWRTQRLRRAPAPMPETLAQSLATAHIDLFGSLAGAAHPATSDAPEEADHGSPPSEIDALIEHEAGKELLRLKARDLARRIYAKERAGQSTLAQEILGADALDQLPRPEFLIDGVLPAQSYGILRGRDASYKSFTATGWSFSLATGSPWLGRATGEVPVLYVAGEGAYGLNARRLAWEQHTGTALAPHMFKVLPRSVDLFAGHELGPLLDVVSEGAFGLVVLDTLRRMSGRADGNTSDMGVVVDAIEEIKRACGGTVLVVSHTDKGDRDTRGFSGIEDDADFVWSMKRDEDSNAVTAELAKMKDGPDGLKVTMRPEPVGGSVVLVETRDMPGTKGGGPLEVAIVGALMAARSIGDELTTSQLTTECGYGRTRTSQTLSALAARGVITPRKSGKSVYWSLCEAPE